MYDVPRRYFSNTSYTFAVPTFYNISDLLKRLILFSRRVVLDWDSSFDSFSRYKEDTLRKSLTLIRIEPKRRELLKGERGLFVFSDTLYWRKTRD